jgi:hypothetical protein
MTQLVAKLPPLLRYHARVAVGDLRQPSRLPFFAAVSACAGATAALLNSFSSDASFIAETVTPLLAAFLAAYCLAPEYQSSMAMLAWRPAFAGKLVLLRVLAVVLGSLAAIGLTFCFLFVFLEGFQAPVSLLLAFPSVWALAILALTFATRYRSPLTGFGVAAAIWGVNAAYGFGIHPLLGLQGYFAQQSGDPIGKYWLLGKVALLVGGWVMLQFHNRFASSRHTDRPDVLRGAVAGVAAVGAYLVTGALLVVTVAAVDHPHETNHRSWVQAKMHPLRPLGIPKLFGPAFEAYIAGGPGESGTSALAQSRQLELAALRWPNSIWAGPMLLESAEIRLQLEPREAYQMMFELADRHQGRPLGLAALRRVLWLEARRKSGSMQREAEPGTIAGFTAARRIVAEYSRSPVTKEAQKYLERHIEPTTPY